MVPWWIHEIFAGEQVVSLGTVEKTTSSVRTVIACARVRQEGSEEKVKITSKAKLPRSFIPRTIRPIPTERRNSDLVNNDLSKPTSSSSIEERKNLFA